jgi:hypothetical protein
LIPIACFCDATTAHCDGRILNCFQSLKGVDHPALKISDGLEAPDRVGLNFRHTQRDDLKIGLCQTNV